MAQAIITASGVVRLKCKSEWTDCQRKQFCSKVRHLDREARKAKEAGKGGSWWRPISDKMKLEKENAQARFKRKYRKPAADSKYYDKCAKKSNKKIQADHKRDVQMGGNVNGPFLYLDASVNTSVGRQIDSVRPRPRPAKGFSAPGCCP